MSLSRSKVVGWSGWMGALLVLATAGGCLDSGPERRVTCREVSVEDRDYCVYRNQSITETGYDCPRRLPNRVPMEGGTVCTENGEIPQEDRDDIRRQIEGDDDGDWSHDVGSSDASSDAGMEDVTIDQCGPPDNCSASSSAMAPSYRCHSPRRPTAGASFTLTIYGQHLAAFSSGEVEIATNTGFKEPIEVDHRCKVSVDLPDYVWGDDTQFEVTLENEEGAFTFTVRGS